MVKIVQLEIKRIRFESERERDNSGGIRLQLCSQKWGDGMEVSGGGTFCGDGEGGSLFGRRN